MATKPKDTKERQGRRSKAQAKREATELALVQQAEQEALEREKARQAKADARLLIKPRTQAALVMRAFRPHGDPDTQELLNLMASRCRDVQGGDLRCVDSMLISQAHSLDAIFAELALRSARNMRGGYLEATETYLKLALRAQSQCRATLETLAAIKNPPVVFAKQANIAHGHQQVNNGSFRADTHVGAPAQETEKPRTELLEHQHGERLDTRAASTARGSDPAVATVVAIHRPAQRRGQGRIKP